MKSYSAMRNDSRGNLVTRFVNYVALSILICNIANKDNKYLSCVYGVDRKICHEGH